MKNRCRYGMCAGWAGGAMESWARWSQSQYDPNSEVIGLEYGDGKVWEEFIVSTKQKSFSLGMGNKLKMGRMMGRIPSLLPSSAAPFVSGSRISHSSDTQVPHHVGHASFGT